MAKIMDLRIHPDPFSVQPFELFEFLRYEMLKVYPNKMLTGREWTAVVGANGRVDHRCKVWQLDPNNVKDVQHVAMWVDGYTYRISGKALYMMIHAYCDECGGSGKMLEKHRPDCSKFSHYVDDHYDSACMNGRCEHCKTAVMSENTTISKLNSAWNIFVDRIRTVK